MALLAKVSVEDLDSSEKVLHEVDKSRSLEENVRDVCRIFEKPVHSRVYALKLVATNDGKFVSSYISEENFGQVKDGYFLKLVYSVGHYVQRIFDHINDNYKSRSFEDLYTLSFEPEFIKALVQSDKHKVLMKHFTEAELADKELTACLIAIVHLFQKGFIDELPDDFLKKLISVFKSDTVQPEQLKYSLSVIHKILCHRDPSFNQWKEEIIKQMPITELTPYIWCNDNKDLQYGALLVINTLIKCCKSEKRQLLIKEINLKQNRESIYNHIILPGSVDKNVAHELYVYQTYLFSLFAEAMNSHISLNDNNLFCRDEFELDIDEFNRLSTLIDFDECSLRHHPSIDNILQYDDNSRISLASMSSNSKFSEDTFYTNSLSNFDYNNLTISHLTLEALRHYKKWHYENFYQSQVEERVYEPGIFVTSEKVMTIIAKLLHVGEEPDKSSTFYQPTVFNCSTKMPFLLELFSRSMWLLSKTRREMKASTLNDYPKVMNVLEKQLQLTLDEKCMNFKILTEKMISNNYAKVMEHWQKEKELEMDEVIMSNPSVLEMKEYYIEENKKLILQQRTNYLKKGEIFPKINEKKYNGHFLAKLSGNTKQLLITEWDPIKKKFLGDTTTYTIGNITHIVEGRACPHVKNNLVKDPSVAFSLIFDNHEYINFKSKDSKTALYWIDTFNILLGKKHRSKIFKKELAELVKMDISLHLLEVQNIIIPKKPPPIPRLPDDCRIKPTIPPKPKINM